MGDWLPWVVVIGLFIASHIERGRHGRYMYRLALRHVEEETQRHEIASGYPPDPVDVREVTSRLREEVGRG